MEETVVCPVCKGYRCLFVDHMDTICGGYNPLNICKLHCGCKCKNCHGIGYISWIDSLFHKDFYDEELDMFNKLVIKKIEKSKRIKKEYEDLIIGRDGDMSSV